MFESELTAFAEEHETEHDNRRTETIRCGSEAVYVGEVKDGNPHGKGKITVSDEEVRSYEGDWVEGIPCGRGIFCFTNGNIYEGEVYDAVPQGKGIMKYANGDTYEGDVDCGIPHGTGKMTFANGDVYEGEWKDGAYHGKGRYMWKDGTYKDGIFVNGKPQ